MIRSLVAALVVACFAWLGCAAPSSAAAVGAPASVSTYTYDINARPAALTSISSERGPPAADGRGNTYDTIDISSHGGSARSDVPTPSVAYNQPIALVHGAPALGTTTGRPNLIGVDLSSPKRWHVAAKGATGAEDVLNGVRLRASLTGKEISGGHAFEKHVIEGGEFPGITTRGQFADIIERVVTNGEMRPLSGGRSAYWQDGTVVIRNPGAADGGTAFIPKSGYDYFLNLH